MPVWAIALAVTTLLFGATTAYAQPLPSTAENDAPGETLSPGLREADNPYQIPDLTKIAPPAADRRGVVSTLQILTIMTVLSLAPSILILTTCFTRIMVVLAMLRQAMGTQQLPPGQVITGLSLFLTFMVMAPTWQRIHQNALVPYLDKKLSQKEAMNAAVGPMREFMIRQIETTENEDAVFMLLEYRRGTPIPEDQTVQWDEVPTTVLIPAFVLSELKSAFIMGFQFYLPFLVIDMVIATILISMGMLMLPPVLISLPFKVALFVLANGWQLIIGTLLLSFS
ncbi:MAG: flagellar type III secretion system pore protein FliP [Phycisphaerae bacterium]|nr:flagellar type III secretion system pore protein FliP [Phycisphaerae bacterium]